MAAPVWLSKAWGWLKRNWKWLLFPIGVLAYVIGRASAKTHYTMVSPSLVEHEEVKNKLEVEAAQKKQAADAAAAQQLNGIERERSAMAADGTKEQIERAEAAQGDPSAVNDLLKQVGKDIRR